MNKEQLLKDLTVLDFMAVDLALYLNTHTEDCEAITKYNEAVTEADKLRQIYEKHYGPLCSYRSASNDHKWCWADEPWPWCEKANFELCRGERF